jgi:hypothetical protein
MNFADESVCLMADNIWNERKLLTCGPLGVSILYGEQCGSLFMICQQ